MRILILVVYYLPSPIASAKLMDDLARELQRLGHEVVVAAPDQAIASDCDVAVEGGIEVLRIRTGEIKSASRWMRAWREITLSSVMWRKGKAFFLRHPFDLVIYYSPTIFFGPLVARLKRLYRCQSYLILRDIFPQWAVDAGVLRRGSPVHLFLKWMERLNHHAATVIGVQSPANLNYFSAQGLDRKYRLEVLYNWASATEDPGLRTEYRSLLGLKDKVVLFYGGNIGVAQDMDNIIRLAEAMGREEKAHFLLVGDGSEVPRLRASIAEKGLKNITLHRSVDQKTYLAMLSEFDVGLVSLDRGLQTQNFPGKMLSYMDQAKPILASVNSGNDLKEILEQYKAGLVSMNGDDERFLDNARRLVRDGDLRRQMGRNAKTLLGSRFSVSRAARLILSHFESSKP